MGITVKIYTLSHPLTNEIRYIGATTYTLQQRLAKHFVTYENNHRAKWIRKLLNDNLEPKIELIEEVSKDNWQFWEKYWISQFKSWGFRLTNATEGGEVGIISLQARIAQIKKLTGSKQTKERINDRASQLSISVDQFTLNGEFIETYTSMAEAAFVLGIKSCSHISECCNGKRSSCKGYLWEYS